MSDIRANVLAAHRMRIPHADIAEAFELPVGEVVRIVAAEQAAVAAHNNQHWRDSAALRILVGAGVGLLATPVVLLSQPDVPGAVEALVRAVSIWVLVTALVAALLVPYRS